MNVAELGLLMKARDEASGVLNNVKGLALGMGAAFIGAAAVAIKAAADEEIGVTRMTQAISNAMDAELLESAAQTTNAEELRGIAFLQEHHADNLVRITGLVEDQIAVWEHLTAFSDGEMRDALSVLIAQTGNLDDATTRMGYAQDFARGTGMDLATAAKLMGKVTDENVNVFKKFGITVEKGADSAELFAKIQTKFGGQAEAFVKTAAGQMTIFKNQVDNLVEDLGGMLLPMFTEGTKLAVGFIDALRGSGALKQVGEAFKTIGAILGELFGVVTGSAPGAGAALTKAIGPEAAKAIMQYLALFRDVVKAIIGGDVPAIFAALGEHVPKIFDALAKFVGDMVPKIAAQLLEWAHEFIAWVKPQIMPLLKELLNLLTHALKWLDDHAEEIGQTLVAWGLKFGEFIVTVALPALIENLPKITATIGEWIVTKAIPAVAVFFWNLGKGMISSLLDALGSLKDDLASAIRTAISAIDFWVGPFHITGSGITIQLPTISLPSFGGGGGGGVPPPPPGTPGNATPGGGYGVPSFAGGGEMPWTGYAYLHAGEIVSKPGEGGGDVHLHFHAPVYGLLDFESTVRRVLREGVRGGGFRGVIADAR